MVGEIDTNEMVSEWDQSNVILLVCDFQILWNQMNTKVFNAEKEQITNGEGSKKHGSDFCSYTSCESVTSILIIIVQNQSFLISEKIHLKVTIIKPSYSFELTLLFALAATDGIYGLDSHWLFLLNHWSWLAVIFFWRLLTSTFIGSLYCVGSDWLFLFLMQSVLDAQWLAYQVQMYYASESDRREEILKTFNIFPDKFDHMTVVRELNSEIESGVTIGTLNEKKWAFVCPELQKVKREYFNSTQVLFILSPF